MKKLLPLTLSLALITIPSLAEEQTKEGPKGPKGPRGERGHGPHGHGHGKELVGRFMRSLELDEAQQAIAKQLQEENNVLREEYHSQMESLTGEMQSIHQSDSFDENRLIEIGGELGQLRVKQGLLMRKFIEGLKPHLNETQLEKLERMKEFMKKMHGRKGHGRPGMKGKRGPTESE